MELLGQGLVLMAAGMGIVYLFLVTLIVTTKLSSSFVAKFDHILPQDAPKKTAKPAAKKTTAKKTAAKKSTAKKTASKKLKEES